MLILPPLRCVLLVLLLVVVILCLFRDNVQYQFLVCVSLSLVLSSADALVYILYAVFWTAFFPIVGCDVQIVSFSSYVLYQVLYQEQNKCTYIGTYEPTTVHYWPYNQNYTNFGLNGQKSIPGWLFSQHKHRVKYTRLVI